MEDLRVKEQEKTLKSKKFKYRFIAFLKKRKWWILGIIVCAVLIVFPMESGQAIGQWIHDFVGNLVKYSKF